MFQYSAAVFDTGTLEDAKRIILTSERDQTTAQRWRTETPLLFGYMTGMKLTADSVVLDYGCGVGRLSKALIEWFGCRVVGADISASMRAFASHYVGSDRFAVCHPNMIETLGVKFDAALAVWVLQHCYQPASDIDLIGSLLKPNGKLFIVNEHHRCVPSKQGAWVDDGTNISDLLSSQGFMHQEGGDLPLDSGRARPPFWAVYGNG